MAIVGKVFINNFLSYRNYLWCLILFRKYRHIVHFHSFVITSLFRFAIQNVSYMHSVSSMFSDSFERFLSWTIIAKISTLFRGSITFQSLVWWAPIFVALPSIKYVGILYISVERKKKSCQIMLTWSEVM